MSSARSTHGGQIESVLAEIGTAAALERRESATFDGLARGARKAVIFGAGPLGRILLTGARESSVDVVAFADNNPALHGTTVEGVRVMSVPDAVAAHNADAYFVVGVYNSSGPRAQLKNLGCARIVPYAAFYWKHAATISWGPGLDLPHRIVASAAAIRAGFGCLADAESREEFAAQIYWRCTLDYSRLPAPDPGTEIYFPPDLVTLSADEVMTDCGAFDGDSIRLFVARTPGGAFRHVYACEPDARNREALARYTASLQPPYRDRVTVFPFAVGDRDATIHFASSGTAGSHITSDQGSGESMECRRLDTLLKDARPTFIKMDIEGAEPDAIAGATRTIGEHHPLIAVCAYHVCEHLWTLPVMLRQACPGYRIFLRRYAEECWEMVYYAIPPGR